ncbi:hypothetical protein [Noviherbaspirillum galbum]|uniref:Uncharacterized protein n=1 Tax=Noviherbaspirillum galbum TaxID=2709383 RepID=A0A6B3SVQ9_9BURK|nr:hypothetical protein [Noviherbaspirillum galbum]NEX62462.1 hypothetical protein [Noviherbaspirillum galbum]
MMRSTNYLIVVVAGGNVYDVFYEQVHLTPTGVLKRFWEEYAMDVVGKEYPAEPEIVGLYAARGKINEIPPAEWVSLESGLPVRREFEFTREDIKKIESLQEEYPGDDDRAIIMRALDALREKQESRNTSLQT